MIGGIEPYIAITIILSAAMLAVLLTRFFPQVPLAIAALGLGAVAIMSVTSSVVGNAIIALGSVGGPAGESLVFLGYLVPVISMLAPIIYSQFDATYPAPSAFIYFVLILIQTFMVFFALDTGGAAMIASAKNSIAKADSAVMVANAEIEGLDAKIKNLDARYSQLNNTMVEGSNLTVVQYHSQGGCAVQRKSTQMLAACEFVADYHDGRAKLKKELASVKAEAALNQKVAYEGGRTAVSSSDSAFFIALEVFIMLLLEWLMVIPVARMIPDYLGGKLRGRG